jgi:hypothetical protein
MSRHKLVKNLDLDDELEDFDGGNNYGDEDGESYGISSLIITPYWWFTNVWG